MGKCNTIGSKKHNILYRSAFVFFNRNVMCVRTFCQWDGFPRYKRWDFPCIHF